jgi:hypothetical protein
VRYCCLRSRGLVPPWFYRQCPWSDQFFACLPHRRYTPESVENTATCGLCTTTDTILCHRFSCYAGDRIHFAVAKRLISIENPGHFTGAGSVVGSRNVNTGSDKILLDQFGVCSVW